ncbi:MAG: NAD(P)-dependent glycerol-3-phosphate dehydrogenase [Deltaproteobacteria bacterium]|nr:NAD(P)-dependent glycerol-3-phosphate dehydrogenase [Deltaproteobacteria bacterium]MBI4224033.1 NAD(P)-dependent glycerol-3-phosphate dehydrogenase [Deltaproteobacteria bacterium]
MKIGVIGAGSWGTALAALLAEEAKNQVILWAFEPEVVTGINQNRRNPLYMSQAEMPKALKVTDKLRTACEGASLLVNAVPSNHTRKVWRQAASFVKPEGIVVNAAKGLEEESGRRLSQVLAEALSRLDPGRIVTLSGPSFAQEVLAHQPTTVVIAGPDKKVAERVQKIFRREWFLVYTHEDQVGVEMGGALKNVIAIATGICDGMGLGYNTRAALITRGLYEMTKLGKALGANPLTFAGLTGMGDLILTCTGELSRNRTVGLRLGKGEKLDAILKNMKNVAEGVKTAKVAFQLIRKHKINNPVFTEVYRILHEGKDPRQALKDLLAIDLKEELGGLL